MEEVLLNAALKDHVTVSKSHAAVSPMLLASKIIYVCMHASMHTCMHTCMYAVSPMLLASKIIYVCMYASIQTCIHTCMYAVSPMRLTTTIRHVCACLSINACMHTYTHAYTNPQRETSYIQTHTHARTHSDKPVPKCGEVRIAFMGRTLDRRPSHPGPSRSYPRRTHADQDREWLGGSRCKRIRTSLWRHALVVGRQDNVLRGNFPGMMYVCVCVCVCIYIYIYI
jgi:hypothetical protein